jgi:hypothetical protein
MPSGPAHADPASEPGDPVPAPDWMTAADWEAWCDATAEDDEPPAPGDEEEEPGAAPALACGPDPLHLTAMFGLDPKTAIRYAGKRPATAHHGGRGARSRRRRHVHHQWTRRQCHPDRRPRTPGTTAAASRSKSAGERRRTDHAETRCHRPIYLGTDR